MNTFHKNFPWGKSIFIWELQSCLAGSLNAIIQKLKDNNIPNVIIKCGDGKNTWSQFNQELVGAFHAAGIKVYAWSYVYGEDPVREADIALWALDMKADGFIFDAESEFEKLPNPGLTATTMLQAVRAKHPEAFIAYSPYPVISSHRNFPYKEFSKFSNAVLPQVYQGEWQMKPIDAVNRMYGEWSAWEQSMRDSGNQDVIQPLIPIMQTYDDYALNPPYVLKPQDIAEFFSAVSGYKAVSMWSFQHLLRGDCWQAIKDNNVLAPTPEELGLSASQNTTQQVSSTAPTATPKAPEVQTPTPATTPAPNDTTRPDSGIVENNTNPTKTPVAVATIPVGGKVIIKNDPSSPTGISVKVHDKVLLDYIIDFLQWLMKRSSKGGENK